MASEDFNVLIEVRLKTMGARGANIDHLALLACEDIRSGLRFGKLPIESVRVEVVTLSPERAIDQEWVRRYIEQLLAYAQKTDSGLSESARLRALHAEDMLKAWRDKVQRGELS